MADDDKAYLARVRQLSCAVEGCRASPPSQPHHHTHRRAFGRRAADRDAMPLCFECHRAFHDGRGPFKDWSRSERREWQDRMVAETQAIIDTPEGNYF